MERITDEQLKAAKEAAIKRYKHNLWTPDRPGWTYGKCPKNEYRAIVAEIGAANFLGIDWRLLCLYSPDSQDFKGADLGEWEVKAGNKFTKKDLSKGKYILWVKPHAGKTYECDVETCGYKTHEAVDGLVEIRGWTHLEEDLEDCKSLRGYYVPRHLRSAWTLVKEDAA
jgi:hypothetical protein